MKVLHVLSTIFLVQLPHYSAVVSPVTSADLHICEAGDKSFLGTFTMNQEQRDGVAVYSNENDMSLFRNNGFW